MGETMASYNIPITIQKLNENTEMWENFYSCHANINKTGGKEYVNASTNISSSTYDFNVRFCEKIEEIIFNTEIYRILYNNRFYTIENVDRYGENHNNVTLIGNFNGSKGIN